MFRWFNWESQLQKRIIVGAGILAVLAIALAFRMLTVFIFDAFILVLVLVCAYELMKTKKLEQRGVRDYYIYPYIVIAYLAFLLGILVDEPFALWLHVVLQVTLIAILCVYVFMMAYTDKELAKRCKLEKKEVGRESRRVVWEYLKLVLYPTFLLFTLIPLNHIAFWTEVSVDAGAYPVESLGLFALLLVLVISMASDTFAYCTGRILKGPKFAESISPNKTITGAVGGLFGGVVGALTVLMIMTTSPYLQTFLTQTIGYAPAVIGTFVAIGLIGSALTQAGDLFASWIKRRANVKDFGKWLPGHGGIMDRVDGIIFNAPFIFFFIMLLVFAV